MPLANGYPGAQPALTAKYGAYTPDWGKLVLNNPIYTSWKTGADLAAGKAGDQRRAAAQFAALNYGGLPSNFQDEYGDLTPDILAQAQANPESTLARLQSGYVQAQQQMQTGLAARGALHSGDLVQAQSNLDTGLATNQYDAGQAFSQAMTDPSTGVYGQYDTGLANAYGGEGAATSQAIQSMEGDTGNPAYQSNPGSNVTLRPDWYGTYGQPIYQGGDGTLYSLGPDGSVTPYTDPRTGQSTAPLLPGSAYGSYPSGTYIPGSPS